MRTPAAVAAVASSSRKPSRQSPKKTPPPSSSSSSAKSKTTTPPSAAKSKTTTTPSSSAKSAMKKRSGTMRIMALEVEKTRAKPVHRRKALAVSQRRVDREQKNVSIVLAIAPLRKLTKAALDDNMLISGAAVRLIAEGLQAVATRTAAHAGSIMDSAGRTLLRGDDVVRARAIMGNF